MARRRTRRNCSWNTAASASNSNRLCAANGRNIAMHATRSASCRLASSRVTFVIIPSPTSSNPCWRSWRRIRGCSLHAYYTHRTEDGVTQRLRGHFAHWHPVAGMSDEALAQGSPRARHRHPGGSVRPHVPQPPADLRAQAGSNSGQLDRLPEHHRSAGHRLRAERPLQCPAWPARTVLCREVRPPAVIGLLRSPVHGARRKGTASPESRPCHLRQFQPA